MLAFNGASIEAAAQALVRTCDLSADCVERLRALEIATERYPAGAVIGPTEEPPHLTWILDGWACEARDLTHGRRQIFSFVVPGEVVRPPDAGWGRTLRALTVVECVQANELLARTGACDDLLAALMRSTALAGARRYEHLSRLAGRHAASRMASLLIELHDRLDVMGLVEGGAFALPLRHEDFADALGLSAAHVTRCMGVLRERGLLNLQFKRVSGFDRAGLEKVCAS